MPPLRPTTAPRPSLLRQIRRITGSLLLLIGLLAASAAYQGAVLRGVVFDTDVVVDASAEILSQQRVQRALADAVVDAALTQLFPAGLREDLLADDVHLTADLHNAALATMQDPRFARLLSEEIGQLHRYLFIDRSREPELVLDELVPVVHDALAFNNPIYNELAPRSGSLRITIPGGELPDLTPARRVFDRSVDVLACISIGLLFAAIAVHPHRPRTLRRVGIWFLADAMLQLALIFALPVAAGSLPGRAGVLGEYMARSLMTRIVSPAVLLLAIATGALTGARQWQRNYDKRHHVRGADAYLTADTRMPAQPGALQVDLSLARPATDAYTPPAPRPRRAAAPTVPDTPAPLIEGTTPTTGRAGR